MIEVGCIGLCSAEPIVDVQLPGKTRASFRSVTHEHVERLLDGVLNGKLPSEMALGQHRPANDSVSTWADLPWLDEHPFFAPQKRWV